ncbi:uncharacterized protein LOC109536490 isoform X2 [Dendroctonus ponderosae]|uniref:Uncharacterized protein n=2 Tax=Dendroctonus ponderosae TaxID=77166 RepID=A0AAR5PC74_DENPD|nr:uncharacterized protein LOC109536490 isoform X2 [Dendroctonus ponderosae]KAH1007261.1 hypothetical protein HUJ04_004518 [Dendroctonus ponderosae]
MTAANKEMAFELVLLGALIFIFIVSFCGLVQKIKQTYTRERLLAERLARRAERQARRRSVDFTDIYVNPSFNSPANGGIFPGAPPPYSQHYTEPPPKYEEAIKVCAANVQTSPQHVETRSSETRPGSEPPPYTITLTTPIAATSIRN